MSNRYHNVEGHYEGSLLARPVKGMGHEWAIKCMDQVSIMVIENVFTQGEKLFYIP